MKYLGIDYGTKKLGVAVSDAAGSFAFPRRVIANDAETFRLLRKIVEEEAITDIVVGDTLTLNGRPNEITKCAETFSQDMHKYLRIPVHRVREAWSSQEAARFAPQGMKHDDASAAAIILQRFLDMQPKSE